MVVRAGDLIIAETTHTVRILETSHPPVFYLDPGDVVTRLLTQSTYTTFCEYKGRAVYWDLEAEVSIPRVAWSYPHPEHGFERIANWLAFYPSKVECRVDGEVVEPQAGDYYGGWVTSEIVGPFKGGPGTSGW